MSSSTIVTAVVGLLLAGATIAGIVASINSDSNNSTPTANVQLYGSR